MLANAHKDHSMPLSLKIQDLAHQILKIQDLAGQILKIQDLEIQDLTCKYWKFKIWKF